MTPYRVRLRRSMVDRVLGGVCGGVGNCLGISGWWVRFAFAALFLTSVSFALLLYMLLWFTMPIQRINDLPPIVRHGEETPPRYAQPEGIIVLGMLAIIIGAVVLAQTTGVLKATGGGDLLAPLMLLIIGLVVLVKHLRGIA